MSISIQEVSVHLNSIEYDATRHAKAMDGQCLGAMTDPEMRSHGQIKKGSGRGKSAPL